MKRCQINSVCTVTIPVVRSDPSPYDHFIPICVLLRNDDITKNIIKNEENIENKNENEKDRKSVV